MKTQVKKTARRKSAIVIGTHNLHKLKEIKKILGPLPFDIQGLDQYPPAYTVRETGKTLEANALIKARAARKHTGRVCLSDDTGLEVKFLNGAPGVYSARFAGPKCSYQDNNRKLLQKLSRVPQSQRQAVFRCVVAVAFPGGEEQVFEGKCPGVIVDESKGSKGFGYDPLFKPLGQQKTFAQMPLYIKNKISHRYKAFRKAAQFLKTRKKSM